MIEIIFASICVVLGSVLIIIIIMNQNKTKLKTTTTMFYFNIQNKTFKMFNLHKSKPSFYRYAQKEMIRYSQSFHSISEFNEFFKNKKIMAKIRKSFWELENPDAEKSSFKYSSLESPQNYQLSFELNMTDSVSGVGYFIWKKKVSKAYLSMVGKSFSSMLKKVENKPFMKIYAIQLKEEVMETHLLLISQEVGKRIDSPLFFSQHQGVLYFVICSKKRKQIMRAHKVLLKLFGENSRMNYIDEIISMVFLDADKTLITKSKINEYKMKLNYILYMLSLKQNKSIHLSSFQSVYTRDSFVKFQESYNTFISLLKSKDIKIVAKPIYNALTKRSSGNFLLPFVSNFLEKNKALFTNEINRELIDMVTYKVATSTTTSFPRGSIVEVSGSWLLHNYNKIQNPNYLYCISIMNASMLGEFSEILNFLHKEKNIKYGLKISDKLQINSLLFKKLNLSFVVIAENISSKANRRKEFSKILLINKLFEGNKAKIIYVNPTNKLDNVQREKLDVKYVVFTN